MTDWKKIKLDAHAFTANKDGSVTVHAEDDDYEVEVVIPSPRIGAVVLAALDAAKGKASVR